VFGEHRPLLFSVAYRMLGSVMDAEDILQEAFLRWRDVAPKDVRSPKSYLTSVVTRLCIDHLRSARVRREEYVGPWLPEPLVSETAPDVAVAVELADSLSLAFLVLLESLTPEERAVFLLHDVFGYPHREIAEIVGTSEASSRQTASRARRRIEARRPRFEPDPAHRERLTERFAHACSTGEMSGLLSLLADDITLWSDGGGKVRAARRPVCGATNVARFLLGVISKFPPDVEVRPATVNGQPGWLTLSGGQVTSVTALEVSGDRITGIYVVLNPDKLQRIPITAH
jgi:RNA polymerase sigma-70 factor (ECF subfamily)